MLRFSLALVALLLVAGCDSSSDVPDGVNGSCALLGQSTAGRMTAATSAGAFSATCFDVSTLSGRLIVVGASYTFGPNAGVVDGPAIQLTIARSEVGTTEIGPFDGLSQAYYTTASGSEIEATSGRVTLSEFSPTRARGTFSFTTLNGVQVTNGSFDVTP